MKNTYEVHITKTYIVEGKDFEEAKAKACLASTGATKDFKFDGMKLTAFKVNRKMRAGKSASFSDSSAKPVHSEPKKRGIFDAFKRTDRSVGKEQEYIDFSQADGV